MTIPLHRVQFSWGPSTHVDIEWAKGAGEPMVGFAPIPAMTVCERETVPDDYAARGVPAICWRVDTPVLFERLQLRENTDYFLDVTVPVTKATTGDFSGLHGRCCPGRAAIRPCSTPITASRSR